MALYLSLKILPAMEIPYFSFSKIKQPLKRNIVKCIIKIIAVLHYFFIFKTKRLSTQSSKQKYHIASLHRILYTSCRHYTISILNK